MKEKKEKKPKSKLRKILEWVFTGIFLALFAVIGLAQIDGLVNKKNHYNQQIRFGYGTFVVQTDSMEPQYKVKTAIITYLEDADKIYKKYEAGKAIDVTFFDAYTAENEYTKPLDNPELIKRTSVTQYPMTHRIREIHIDESKNKGEGRYTFITAGINTRSENMGWREGDPEITIDQYQVFTERELLGVVHVNSPFLGGVFGFVSSIWGLLILLLIPSFYLIITSVIDIFKAYKEPEEKDVIVIKENSGEVQLSEEDKKRLKEELLKEMLEKKKGE